MIRLTFFIHLGDVLVVVFVNSSSYCHPLYHLSRSRDEQVSWSHLVCCNELLVIEAIVLWQTILIVLGKLDALSWLEHLHLLSLSVCIVFLCKNFLRTSLLRLLFIVVLLFVIFALVLFVLLIRRVINGIV